MCEWLCFSFLSNLFLTSAFLQEHDRKQDVLRHNVMQIELKERKARLVEAQDASSAPVNSEPLAQPRLVGGSSVDDGVNVALLNQMMAMRQRQQQGGEKGEEDFQQQQQQSNQQRQTNVTRQNPDALEQVDVEEFDFSFAKRK